MIFGTIVEVADDGVMLVSPSGGLDDGDTVKIRNWGLVIDDPARLRLLILGQYIDCGVLYKIEAYIGGSCRIIFTQKQMSANARNFPPNAFPFSRGPLRVILPGAEVAHGGCSTEDLLYLPKKPPERDMRRKTCERLRN